MSALTERIYYALVHRPHYAARLVIGRLMEYPWEPHIDCSKHQRKCARGPSFCYLCRRPRRELELVHYRFCPLRLLMNGIFQVGAP